MYQIVAEKGVGHLIVLGSYREQEAAKKALEDARAANMQRRFPYRNLRVRT